uniref:Uncharacterized protein n=1 Tax=Triticum urartu TaxID=4572 RepID=A0A8R7VCE3_TRIUA
MIRVLYEQATLNAELIDPYPTMPTNNPIYDLNELCSCYFGTILMSKLIIGIIIQISKLIVGIRIRNIGAIES